MSIRLKTIFIMIAAVLAVGYVLVMGVMSNRTENESVRCHAVECRFNDSVRYRYISAGQVRKYLHQTGCYPVGKTLDDICLQVIEDTLLAHPIIASANCYMGADGTMYAELTQRQPIAHVVTGHEDYFVATDRKPMPTWSTVKDSVLQVRGNLTHEQTCGEVADFAEWLLANSTWRSRIEYLSFRKPHFYTLRIIGDTTQYILGDLNNYAVQLQRLLVYESQRSKLPQKEYGQIDLRFDNQVVTRP